MKSRIINSTAANERVELVPFPLFGYAPPFYVVSCCWNSSLFEGSGYQSAAEIESQKKMLASRPASNTQEIPWSCNRDTHTNTHTRAHAHTHT